MSRVRSARWRRRLAGAFAGALLAVAASACSTSSATEVPDGYVAYEGDGYTFVYPEDFTAEESDGPMDVDVLGPVGDDGMRQAIAAGAQDGFPSELGIDDYVLQFDVAADSQMPGREVVRDAPLEVPGAEAARLVESRFAWPAEDGADVAAHQADLLVLAGDGVTMGLRFSSPLDRLDEDVLETVVGSFRVRG